MLMRKRTAVSAVLAALTLLATLFIGNGASADNTGPTVRQNGVEVSVRPHDAKLDADCWTKVEQPGGAGTTIYVKYINCSPDRIVLTVTASAVNGSGTWTYVASCQVIDGYWTVSWTIPPSAFPPAASRNYTTTVCI